LEYIRKEGFNMRKLSLLLFFMFMFVFALTPMASFAAENESIQQSGDELDPGSGGGSTYYPGSTIQPKPGDVLYTTKSTTQYFTGHVGIVSDRGTVVHTPGPDNPGIKEWTIGQFFNEYSTIEVWSSKNSTKGNQAGSYARNTLLAYYSNAEYTISTSLTGPKDKQYCTKVVWQSYYYGASINLGDLSFTALGVAPSHLLDREYLTRVY
jgi:uncharacterized protein YycO